MTLPHGWSYKTLRELATINYGRDPRAILDDDGEYPVYGTSGSERRGTGHLYDGDSVILGRKGTIDRVHLVAGRFWTIDTAYFLSDFRAVPQWLYYSLCSRDLRALNEATGVPSLSRDVLYKLAMPTPPPGEQSKIVGVLSTVDRAIEQGEALIAKQLRIKTGVMQDLLTRGIDDRGTLRSVDTHKFKESSLLGSIPVDWSEGTVGGCLAQVAPSMRSGPFGSALRKEDLVPSGVPLLGIDNVFPEEFRGRFTRFVSERHARRLSRYRVRPLDLMITIMGTVGRCCVVPDDIGVAISSKHVWTITVDALKYLPHLMCYQVNYSPWVRRHFARDEQGGIMGAITSGTIRTTPLPVPPIAEQLLIAEHLLAMNSELAALRRHVLKLNLLKTGMMNDLLTGKRRVTTLLPLGELVTA